MAARPVIIDITRLASHTRRKGPSGVDRVELAYADAVLSSGRCAGAIVAERIGARWLDADAAGRLLRQTHNFWREAPEASPAEGGGISPLALLRQRSAFARRLARAGSLSSAVYLRASHDKLEKLSWLRRWPNLAKLFFIHDILPVQWPEYFVAGEADRHQRRLALAARFADALLVSSAAAAHDLAQSGLTTGRPLHILPLGIEPIFAQAPIALTTAPDTGGAPYFVMCSTLEPRKNHLLILNLWRALAQSGTAPKLVIVGRRGWENEAIVDMLERCAALRPHVTEMTDMTTPALANLLRGARALLAPSFAEGFGIPVLEALAVGTPVIASDIPPHREIAGGMARFLDPLDGPAWRAAVLEAARAQPERIAGFEPPRWPAHIARLFDIIDALPQRG